MAIQFGKHLGKSCETVVLKHPDYVSWMFDQTAGFGQLSAARDQVGRLIREFDAKSIVAPCREPGCDRPATRGSVYVGTTQWRWRCDDCDPTGSGVSGGKLVVLRTYGEVLRYVSSYCNSRKAFAKGMIRDLARAKGLPDRVGEAEAVAFFR